LGIWVTRIYGERLAAKLRIRKSPDNPEGSAPAGSSEEMLHQIGHVAEQRIYRGSREILCRSLVGPVNQKRFSDDVVAWNKPPVAAVERIVAIVAHREIAVRRNYDLAVHHVMLQHVPL